MPTRSIEKIMTKKVITAKPGDLIKDIVHRLAEYEISGLPVVDTSNKVIGMISEKDILKALKTESRTLSMVFPSSHALGMTFEESVDYRELKEAMKEMQNSPIEKIMNKNVITVKVNTTIAEVASIMIQNNVNRLPVVKDNKLIGIITRGDIILGLSKSK